MNGRVWQRLASHASFWGLVEYGCGPAVALAAVPLLFRQLGTAGFGQYAMIMAVAGLGNVANPGSAVTATKLVSENRHRPAGALWAAGVALMLVCMVLAGAALIVGTASLALGLFWPQAAFGDTALYALVPAAGAIYAAQQLDQVYAGALKGREAFAATALCECAGRVAVMALACAAAWATHAAWWVAAAQGIGLLLAATAKMMVFAHAEGRWWVRPVADRDALAKTFQFSRWTWLHSISALAFSSLDRIVVGQLMGPAVLALYAIGVQAGQLIHTAAVAIFQKAMPRVRRLWLTPPGPGAARDEIRQLVKWNLAFSVAATLALLGASPFLLTLLAGPARAAGQQFTFDLLILASGLLSMNAAAHFSLLGLGNGRAVALLNSLGGLAMLALMAALFGMLGQNAAAAGRMAYAAVTLAGIGLALSESRRAEPAATFHTEEGRQC
jgi:O-antigen/teichoic acid export membrane protein